MGGGRLMYIQRKHDSLIYSIISDTEQSKRLPLL